MGSSDEGSELESAGKIPSATDKKKLIRGLLAIFFVLIIPATIIGITYYNNKQTPVKNPLELEAESSIPSGKTTIGTDEGASGQKYLVLSAPKSVTQPLDIACPRLPTDAGIAITTVTIPKTASYKIWGRLFARDFAVSLFFLQIDDSCPKVFGNSSSATSSTWAWIDFQNASGPEGGENNTVSLTSGAHIFRFVGLTPDVKIDKLLLVQDPSCTPVDNGNNCEKKAN